MKDGYNRYMTSYVLGGGCFWCLDAVYRQLKGVEQVESGLAGILDNHAGGVMDVAIAGHQVLEVLAGRPVIPTDWTRLKPRSYG